MKKSIVSTVVLVSICAVMAILLALTNSVTAPIIKKNQDAAANAALLEVMPNGKGFEKVEFDAAALPKTVTEVYKEQGGGYVITLTTTGYGSGLVIMCGVNAEGIVTGATCLASQETLLYSPELKFYSNRVKMDENLNTNVKGLHCLGDSSGWTRGLMMASVMGVIMGRHLAEEK